MRNYVRVISSIVLLLLAPALAHAVVQAPYVTAEAADDRLGIIVDGTPLPLVVSREDHPGVIRVAKLLQADFERVSGAKPPLATDGSAPGKHVILVGTLGKSPLIDQLVHGKKLDVSKLEGKWETFVVQVVEQPMDGIDRALVIAGSDKRGTIFGMFDLSLQIGVSPWHFWADVPVQRQRNLYVLPGRHTDGTPAVKYRGIFINDEAPALAGWAHEKFGGFNAKFYDHVFELILRLKGNYLWPAMWGRAIYDDDPESPKLADEYGVVLGTSHHEPLMRAHVEWERYGKGPWNYEKNEAVLREFWAEGIRRMGTNDSIVTIGMRGDGDEPMTESANIALLERIVRDQRDIVAKETGHDAAEQPQIWALYKEVQEYYDKGMRVPNDVTLLLCDDNWGNIRKLPKPTDPPRPGGYGIYYHFDYVGGPRNYKWINTNQIARVWEQMNLAYEHGVNRIWIVNVGDIKPMELPTEFFLDFAWNPEQWPAERLPEYTHLWAAEQFGEAHAAEIAEILTAYTTFNSRRKPELLSPDTYSLENFREAERVVDEYNALVAAAKRINEQLPAEYRDAFFQLVLYPVEACANLNELYVTVAKNRKYAKEGRAETNNLAQRARELFKKDADLSRYYNRELAGGKWNHMADQTHIGYTYWQEPPKNEMPAVVELEPNEIKVRASTKNAASADIRAAADDVAGTKGPAESDHGAFIEADGYISIEAEHFTRAVGRGLSPFAQSSEQKGTVPLSDGDTGDDSDPIRWQIIPNLGRTLSGVTALPSTAPSDTPGDDSPRLEYAVDLASSGPVNVRVLVSPTLNFYNNDGLRYAVSFDDHPPRIVNIHAGENLQVWEKWVADNINETTTEHRLDQSGQHTLKFWRVDPGIVLQKLIIDRGDLPPSYLGPPESLRAK